MGWWGCSIGCPLRGCAYGSEASYHGSDDGARGGTAMKDQTDADNHDLAHENRLLRAARSATATRLRAIAESLSTQEPRR
jgi:hypothetical protein